MQLSAPTFPTDPAANFPFDGASPNSKSGHVDDRDSSPADFGRMLSAKTNGDRDKSPRPSTTARNDSSANARTSSHHRRAGHRHRAAAEESDHVASEKNDGAVDQNALLTIVPTATQSSTPQVDPAISLISGPAVLEPSAEGQTSAGAEDTVESNNVTPLVAGSQARGIWNRAAKAQGRGPAAGSEENRVNAQSAQGVRSPAIPALNTASVTRNAVTTLMPNETLTVSSIDSNPVVTDAVGVAATPRAAGADTTMPAVNGAPLPDAARLLASQATVAHSDVKQASAAEPVPSPAISGAPAASTDKMTIAATSDLVPTPVSQAGLEEKIAAALSPTSDQDITTEKPAQKTSLNAGVKKVESSYGRLGINAAKPETLMPSPAQATLPITPVAETTSFDATPLSFEAWSKDGSDGAPMVEHSSREAVESVRAASEQLTAGVQRSVKLQFSVGGEELAVRVELRGDRVHTTFRTDSPELRSALAREWQAVSTQQNGDRGQRLADPVFASSSSASNNSFSSDSGAAHQRDPESRHAREAAAEAGAFRRALRAQPAAASVSTATSAASTSTQSRRLQTFA
jgi:hypothetical protein